MKKIIFSLAFLSMVGFTTVSCGGDDDNGGETPVNPSNPDNPSNPSNPSNPAQPGALNTITIEGVTYSSSFGYMNVYGDTETGEILGTYTWTPEESGLAEDVLASEWVSFQILDEEEDGSYYYVVSLFDVPMESEDSAYLPHEAPYILSYGQRLYYRAAGATQATLYADRVSENSPITFSTFTLGNFGQTENGDIIHELSSYAYKTFYSFEQGVASNAEFSGSNTALFVLEPDAGRGTKLTIDQKFERASKLFDINKVRR